MQDAEGNQFVGYFAPTDEAIEQKELDKLTAEASEFNDLEAFKEDFRYGNRANSCGMHPGFFPTVVQNFICFPNSILLHFSSDMGNGSVTQSQNGGAGGGFVKAIFDTSGHFDRLMHFKHNFSAIRTMTS